MEGYIGPECKVYLDIVRAIDIIKNGEYLDDVREKIISKLENLAEDIENKVIKDRFYFEYLAKLTPECYVEKMICSFENVKDYRKDQSDIKIN